LNAGILSKSKKVIKKISKIKFLALINARGGSKGIPKKNIKVLGGKPLIAHTIEAAKKSKLICKIVVSTDCVKISKIAFKYGAQVPFLRPSRLAKDTSLQIGAIKHALQFFKERGETFEAVVLLQPTCPLRTKNDIDKAILMYIEKSADTVISITDVAGFHPAMMYWEKNGGKLVPFYKKYSQGVTRQHLPKCWWRNGAVYVIRSQQILAKNAIYGKKIFGFKMPLKRSLNIDEPCDWKIAKEILEKNKQKTS